MDNGNNGNKKKIGTVLAVLFVLAVIVVGVFSLVGRRDTAQADSDKPEIRVAITEDGFLPSTVTVVPGTTVVWVNDTAAPHSVGSDPYPDASSLPGLKSETIAPGESYAYTFNIAGSFNYADYTNPTTTGTIQVK